MAYEEAFARVGEQPTWVLRDLIDRLPYANVNRWAAEVVLKHRSRD